MSGDTKPLAWRHLRWYVTAALAAAAFAFSFHGFMSHFKYSLEPSHVLSAAYQSLQLFVLQMGDIKPPIPWTLEVGRFLAPLVAAYTAVQGLMLVFREQADLLRLKFYRRHLILCGLGQTGFSLAQDLTAARERLVAIEKDRNNPVIPALRRLGVIIIEGDALDQAVLAHAGIGQASCLIACLGSDDDNIEVSFTADALAGERGEKLPCSVRVENVLLREMLSAESAPAARYGGCEVRSFSNHENMARMFFLNHMPGIYRRISSGRPLRLIIVGLNLTGEALALQAARIAHFPRSPLEILIVDPDPEERERELRFRYPFFEKVCGWQFLQLDRWEKDFPPMELYKRGKQIPFTVIVSCLDDVLTSVNMLSSIAVHPLRSEMKVFIKISDDYGVSRLLETAPPDIKELVSTFGDLANTCTADVVLHSSLDRKARAIHEDYVANQVRKGQRREDNPYLCGWGELPEDIRKSNRHQADHLLVKLLVAGAWEDRSAIDLGPALVEDLSRAEHRRWCAERYLSGWRHAKKRDNSKKFHPDLIPWERLSEEAREKDREAVRNIPALLKILPF